MMSKILQKIYNYHHLKKISNFSETSGSVFRRLT